MSGVLPPTYHSTITAPDFERSNILLRFKRIIRPLKYGLNLRRSPFLISLQDSSSNVWNADPESASRLRLRVDLMKRQQANCILDSTLFKVSIKPPSGDFNPKLLGPLALVACFPYLRFMAT